MTIDEIIALLEMVEEHQASTSPPYDSKWAVETWDENSAELARQLVNEIVQLREAVTEATRQAAAHRTKLGEVKDLLSEFVYLAKQTGLVGSSVAQPNYDPKEL